MNHYYFALYTSVNHNFALYTTSVNHNFALYTTSVNHSFALRTTSVNHNFALYTTSVNHNFAWIRRQWITILHYILRQWITILHCIRRQWITILHCIQRQWIIILQCIRRQWITILRCLRRQWITTRDWYRPAKNERSARNSHRIRRRKNLLMRLSGFPNRVRPKSEQNNNKQQPKEKRGERERGGQMRQWINQDTKMNDWMKIYIRRTKSSARNLAYSQRQMHTVHTRRLSQAKTTKDTHANMPIKYKQPLPPPQPSRKCNYTQKLNADRQTDRHTHTHTHSI